MCQGPGKETGSAGSHFHEDPNVLGILGRENDHQSLFRTQEGPAIGEEVLGKGVGSDSHAWALCTCTGSQLKTTPGLYLPDCDFRVQLFLA